MGLNFNYRDAVGTANLEQGGALTGWDYFAPASIIPAFGTLIVLNGLDQNKKMVDGATTTALWPLIPTAPYGELSPTVSMPGTGHIYGTGYKWRYRFVASTTGEATGMTESPAIGINMGVVTTTGGSNVLGSTAYFYIPGRSGDDGTYYDRIQLIRNTSGQESVWYVVDEKANPGGSSYVLFTDDFTDDQIVLNELADLLPNPAHEVGPMWPVAKGYPHPTGRMWYYGIVPMGRHSNGTATVAANARTAAIVPSHAYPNSDPDIPKFRVGQRFLPTANSVGTPFTPTQTYSIVASGTGAENDLDFYPQWAEGAMSNFYYQIEDDRDPRTVFMSEPGLPSQVDPIKSFFVGFAKDDPLYHIFGMGGVTYAITRRRIYRIDDDFTEDPSLSLRISVVADEGCVGLWACAETPMGLVYVNDSRGVRVFDGEMPKPLGGEDVLARFPAFTQFQGFDQDYRTHARVLYDAIKHRVFVSYPPTGSGRTEESLVYDIERGNWRGPWRMNLTALFNLLDDGGGMRQVFGDNFGNLMTDEDAALDVFSQDTGQTLSGAIDTVNSPISFSVTGLGGLSMDPSSDKRIVGCPIVFYDVTNDIYYHNWIAGWDGTYVSLLNIPTTALVSGWTFKIGALKWQATSGYLDADEPIQPKTFENLRMRLEPGTASADTARISASPDGLATYAADGAGYTSVPSYDTTAAVPLTHCVGSLHQGGQDFQFRLNGTSQYRFPRITKAIADINVGGGAPRTP